MTRLLTGSFAAAVLCAGAIVGAQTRPPAAPKAPNTYDPSKTDTVVGCLRPGTMTGTFVVADAIAMKGAPGTVTPVGTSGAPKKTYTIRGIIPPGTDLNKLVNHKVEVAGTIGESDDKTPNVNMHTFKSIAAKCS